MHIIRECVDNGELKHCILRSNHYGCALDFILTLYAEAQKDFPELQAENVAVVKFGGMRYKGTTGIEFKTAASIPETYQQIAETEQLLG